MGTGGGKVDPAWELTRGEGGGGGKKNPHAREEPRSSRASSGSPARRKARGETRERASRFSQAGERKDTHPHPHPCQETRTMSSSSVARVVSVRFEPGPGSVMRVGAGQGRARNRRPDVPPVSSPRVSPPPLHPLLFFPPWRVQSCELHSRRTTACCPSRRRARSLQACCSTSPPASKALRSCHAPPSSSSRSRPALFTACPLGSVTLRVARGAGRSWGFWCNFGSTLRR